jgi:hypothetical protein
VFLKRRIEWKVVIKVWFMFVTIVYLNHPGEISPSPSDIELTFGTTETAPDVLMGGQRLNHYGGTVSADDNSGAIMFDLVNPVGTSRWPLSFNRLSWNDQPGRKTLELHALA